MFVGAERTSTIFIFDITNPDKVSMESHISAAGDLDLTPEDAWKNSSLPKSALGQIDPEHMSYDEKRGMLAFRSFVLIYPEHMPLGTNEFELSQFNGTRSSFSFLQNC